MLKIVNLDPGQLKQIGLLLYLMVHLGYGAFYIKSSMKADRFWGRYLILPAALLVELQLLIIAAKIFLGNVLTFTPLN